MRKISLISIAMLIVSIPTFAGGLLTNTNQHPAFLRMLSRGANTTSVDAALSNPAGLAFLPKDGFYTSLSIQSAFQTRNIDASCEALGLDKYYEGKASAPVIPSVFAAYKKGDWTISGFFGITGGGGKASFDDGLSMFDAMVKELSTLHEKMVQKDELQKGQWRYRNLQKITIRQKSYKRKEFPIQ